MQFHKLELPIRNPEPPTVILPTYRINDEEVCRVCGINEVWGYAGNGVYVPHTCRKCYRSAGRESKAEAKNPRFYHLEGKS